MLHGSPGIGKSAIVQSIAKEFGLLLIDLRLAQCDPTDLSGFPSVDPITKRASYSPMSTFPLEGDVIPAGYNGWLLFLDEINSANQTVMAAAYKLVLDRAIGQHKLHKNVAIVCAGNLETDNAIVEPMGTAMQSRMVHLEIALDAEEWLEWATSTGFDHRIISFIRFKVSSLYTFSPDHGDKTYACPRSWEFANRLLPKGDAIPKELLPLLAGALSEGVAREFAGFCSIYTNLPAIASILQYPTLVEVPQEPSTLYALTGALGESLTVTNAAGLMQYINRMPVEFQVLTMRSAIKRDSGLVAEATISEWISTKSVELF